MSMPKTTEIRAKFLPPEHPTSSSTPFLCPLKRLDRWLCLQLAERLDTIHDALIGVFVNLHGDKLGLADSHDRRHHQHRLVQSH